MCEIQKCRKCRANPGFSWLLSGRERGIFNARAGNQALRVALDTAPAEGKVFRLVARRNPFTERISCGSPAPPLLGLKSPKSQKAPPAWGAFCGGEGGIFNARVGNQALRVALDTAPAEGKVFRLVARRNPFTERISCGSPAPPLLGLKSPKSQKAPPAWGAFCGGEGGI